MPLLDLLQVCELISVSNMSRKVKQPLSTTHSHLLKEWDYSKNGDLRPENITYGSHKKVWWKCRSSGHFWRAIIKNRARDGNGCPVCAGKLVTHQNNIVILKPKLMKEWDFSRNLVDPSTCGRASKKKVWWVCGKCRYNWKSIISSRALLGCGCPACSGRVATIYSNITLTHPGLMLEWDFGRNTILPEKVKSGSDIKVWWLCSRGGCGYNWKSSVYNRTCGCGCPACAGRVVTDRNNFAKLKPELRGEWDIGRNRKGPEQFTCMSSVKVWWVCSVCGNSWNAHISSRSKGHGCPACSKGNISKISQKWLDFLKIPKKCREYYFKDLNIRVDAYVLETNTVYEFLGDYWHGNPNNLRFLSNKVNPSNKKTFGQLYKETMERIEKLRSAGFKVVYIWENDFVLNQRKQ